MMTSPMMVHFNPQPMLTRPSFAFFMQYRVLAAVGGQDARSNSCNTSLFCLLPYSSCAEEVSEEDLNVQIEEMQVARKDVLRSAAEYACSRQHIIFADEISREL